MRSRLFLLSVLIVAARAAEPAITSGKPAWHAGFSIIDKVDGGRGFVSGAVMALARTRSDLLFVGSNRLAVFDGHSWRRIEIGGATRTTALAFDPYSQISESERVWIAGDGALGYVETDATGTWRFHSLARELRQAGLPEIADIRHIHAEPGGAVFVSRDRVLRWDGQNFTAWHLPGKTRLFAFEHNRDLQCHHAGAGILTLTPAGPQVSVPESDFPVPQTMVAAIPATNDRELAVFFDSAFVRHRGEWHRADELTRLIATRRALMACRVREDLIAIGTAYGGVILCRDDGSIVGLVNGQSGLFDDNIDALLADSRGQLWIGTGTGLACLSGAGTTSLFDQRARLAMGAARAVVERNGRTYVMTSRRMYELMPAAAREPARFLRFETIWPQLRAILVRDGELWVGGNGGLWRLDGRNFRPEPSVPDDAMFLLPMSARPGGVYVVDQDAIRVLSLKGENASILPADVRLASPPTSALSDSDGRIWIATTAGEIVCYRWEPSAGELRVEKRFSAETGRSTSPGGLRLAQLGPTVFVFTERGALMPNEPTRSLVTLAGFDGIVPEVATALTTEVGYWCVQSTTRGPNAPGGLIRVSRAGGGFRWDPLEVPGLDHLGDLASIDITHEGGRAVLWIGGENGLLRTYVDALREAPPPPSASLHHVKRGSGEAVALGRGPDPAAFSAKLSRLEFSYGAGLAAANGGMSFQTQLAGAEENWSNASVDARREFTAIAAGAYEFRVRVVDRFGRAGPATHFAFSVEPPWYRRAPAVVLWIGLAAVGIIAAVRWRLHRLRSQATRLEQLVNARTRELSLSNTARAEFLDSLSHEIRRPLNGILSLTRRLAASNLTPEQRIDAELLQEGGESLFRVCDQVLNGSALEHGAAQVNERRFKLRELIASVVHECFHDGPIPSVVWPDEFTDGFVADDAKLATIVANFASNARTHAAGAPIEIEVSVTDRSSALADLLIEVTDGGPGVPAEEQELIFRRFVRGSGARDGGIPGTGIGLATCRVMARLLAGNVGVESPSERARNRGFRGAGATFFVRIPVRRAGAQTDSAQPAAGPSGMRVKPFSIA